MATVVVGVIEKETAMHCNVVNVLMHSGFYPALYHLVENSSNRVLC